jgi:hypothetical protein
MSIKLIKLDLYTTRNAHIIMQFKVAKLSPFNNLRGFSVGIIDGNDLRRMPLKWPQVA